MNRTANISVARIANESDKVLGKHVLSGIRSKVETSGYCLVSVNGFKNGFVELYLGEAHDVDTLGSLVRRAVETVASDEFELADAVVKVEFIGDEWLSECNGYYRVVLELKVED